jgi:hypothetical protein
MPEPQGTEAKVVADIVARQQLGIAKYGKTVADNPLSLREWLQHAYEECLDQAVYLRRSIELLDQKFVEAEAVRREWQRMMGMSESAIDETIRENPPIDVEYEKNQLHAMKLIYRRK